MIKQIILIEKKSAYSKLPSIIRNDDLCYLLSKDYTSYLRLNKIVPDDCKVLNLAGRVNREIERLRNGYINLFTDLSKKHDSIEWWSSNIASRSSTAIPLQLNITYLFCAKKIIDDIINSQSQKRLIFIADSQALLNSIAILGEKRNLNIVQFSKRIKKIVFYFKLFFLYTGRICLFAWNCYRLRKLAFPILKPISFDHSLKRRTILIRSWITKDTLNDDGLFKDRIFGALPDWLKSKGYEVIILPMFFNIGGSLKDLFLSMKKQNAHFIIQDCYFKIVDYIKVIYIGWKEINIPLKKIRLETIDLTPLFREIQLQQGFDYNTLNLNLCFPLLKRIEELGIKIDRFYYPLENNVPEKPFILGCKKYFPHSEVVGYQHSVWMKNQLSMFFGDGEAEHHPIADKIICSGSYYSRVLKDAHFPENKIFQGPNLRFTSVHKNLSTSNQDIKRPNILLMLTFDDELALDLIHKVKSLQKDFQELFVYIRRHPSLNYKKIENFLDVIEMTNFQYADIGDILEWLPYTDIALSSGASVTILETIAMSIPLLRVVPDNNFLLDPLAWSDYPIKPVNSAEEIKISIRSIIEMTQEAKNNLTSIGTYVLSNYFQEANEDNLQVFC